jgi:outer membrane protein assembly factor BamB
MRTLWTAALTFLAAVTMLPAQDPRTEVFSWPTIPSDEALRRLNLTVKWRAAVPMAGRRDGFRTIQLNNKDLFAVSRSGMIFCYDAESGLMRWKASAGRPWEIGESVGFNTRSVFVTSGTFLVTIDRSTGQVRWRYNLPGGVSAPPVADDDQIYISSVTSDAYAFALPPLDTFTGRVDRPRSLADAMFHNEREDTPRPKPIWVERTDLRLEFRPLQTPEVIFFFSPSGSAIAFEKFPREVKGGTTELYRFSTDKKVRQTPGQYDDTAFIGSEDAHLYAIDLNHGKLRWRFTAGSPVSHRPASTEQDVFVTSEREGLARLDRKTGDAPWRIPRGRAFLDANPDADLFLAANDRFVYATDGSRRLLVLDRKRGVTLSRLDTRAFAFPVVNEVTDRVYLAANNGLIVCLRDRNQVAAIRHRKIEEDTSGLLKRKLSNIQVTTEFAGKPTPLNTVLDDLRKKYSLKITISEAAFQKAGNPNVGAKDVKTPKVELRPLDEYIQQILNQVNATYEVAEDTILVVPGKPKGK